MSSPHLIYSVFFRRTQAGDSAGTGNPDLSESHPITPPFQECVSRMGSVIFFKRRVMISGYFVFNGKFNVL